MSRVQERKLGKLSPLHLVLVQVYRFPFVTYTRRAARSWLRTPVAMTSRVRPIARFSPRTDSTNSAIGSHSFPSYNSSNPACLGVALVTEQ